MPQTIQMANLGMADSLILMVMALVVFGPRRLPQIGRQIGKLMYEFRKASNDFKFQMEEELRNAEDADRRKKEEERLRALALTAPEAVLFDETKANAESPAIKGAAAFTETESPYPGEALYPVQPSAAVEMPSAETYPRIQPPSTGEPVPSLRRTTLAAQAKETEETGDVIGATAEAAPAEQNNPVTEPANKDA
ncbi:MAG: twin-arginine translocase TatA/TatE family subunit [Terracidiphilus sp.]|nr:twin-arginine translocase TatA/TatE family subunit [Terracidiphilus sp.]